MTVRKADTRDVRAIRYLMHPGPNAGILFPKARPTYIHENLHTTWVMVDNKDVPIAYLLCHIPSHLEDTSKQDAIIPASDWQRKVYLDSCTVRPECRGEHIMAKLCLHAMEKLSNRGFCHFFAEVHPDNIAAIKSLYRLGFQDYAFQNKTMRRCYYKEYGREG